MARMEIQGRTALVTGGTGGIGLALTRRLLQADAARVVVVGRDAAKLAAVEADGRGRVVPLRADLSTTADVDRLLDELPELAPELSLAVNNAGTQTLTDFTRGDPRLLLPALRAEISANVSGVVALSVGLLPLLAAQPSAALLNVTSGLALAPKQSAPVYCATKAGVRSFTRALRYQCEDALPQVRVVEALPPLVDTDMTRGRGSGKISADECAAEMLAGLTAGRDEIYVGRSTVLRTLMRISPSLGHRIMRNG